MSIEDKTGQPSELRDYQEAIAVVRKYVVVGITTLPPDLAVQLPNILRCLAQGMVLTDDADRLRKMREA